MRIIGVDTDSKGSMAVIDDESKTVTVYYVPSHKRELKNGTKRVTLNRRVTTEYCGEMFKNPIDATYVEEQWSRPDQAAGATFTFGCIYCSLVQALESAAVHAKQKTPLFEVHSTIWKSRLGLTSDKAEARALASKVFPDCSTAWEKADYTSAAEATLIAMYGYVMEAQKRGRRAELILFKPYSLILPAKRRVTLTNS